MHLHLSSSVLMENSFGSVHSSKGHGEVQEQELASSDMINPILRAVYQISWQGRKGGVLDWIGDHELAGFIVTIFYVFLLPWN